MEVCGIRGVINGNKENQREVKGNSCKLVEVEMEGDGRSSEPTVSAASLLSGCML